MTITLQGKRVLLVEDEPIVAMTAEDILCDLGAEVVGPVAYLEQALQLATSDALDIALLDVNLNGRMSHPVAEALRKRGVPYVVATGYGDIAKESMGLDAPVVTKPYTREILAEALAKVAA